MQVLCDPILGVKKPQHTNRAYRYRLGKAVARMQSISNWLEFSRTVSSH